MHNNIVGLIIGKKIWFQSRGFLGGRGELNNFKEQKKNKKLNRYSFEKIGRKGETIKQIRDRSGADRVYMQNESSRDMNSEL